MSENPSTLGVHWDKSVFAGLEKTKGKMRYSYTALEMRLYEIYENLLEF